MDYLLCLNDAQREAVEATEGPVMIVAGAGSGKTRVLTYRIVHLIENGVKPENILALTFTNKAAKEMKDRIYSVVRKGYAMLLWAGTFHSIFARILRIEGYRLGYTQNFSIYDNDDSKRIIKQIIKGNGLNEGCYDINAIYKRISLLKSNLISYNDYIKNDAYLNDDELANRPLFSKIYKLYNEYCKSSDAMDFDDLLYNMNLLLRDYEDVLLKYQNRFQYINVDEYQDTNFAQYLIVKKLSLLYKNVCVVGDDAQSIYSFRGANIENILNFKEDYPEVKIYKLEQNYRSTKNILGVANSIIVNNRHQLEKTIWTDRESGSKVKVVEFLMESEETQYIANSIKSLITKYDYNDIAILYRNNSQSRLIEEALRNRNIPYKVYGGLSFFKRKEVKDVLAYFRLVINNKDTEALLRIINYPPRGIGETTIEKLISISKEKNITIWEILEEIDNYSDIALSSRKSIKEFVNEIKKISALLNSYRAFELAKIILDTFKIKETIYKDRTLDGKMKYENLEELINSIKEYDDNMFKEKGEVAKLHQYMEDVSLLIEEKEEDDGNLSKVSLMTIHSAKGLEFKNVFIYGVVDGILPSRMREESIMDIEEERRLFYVAVTRAKDNLTISYSLRRSSWGEFKKEKASRFIDEIDKKYLDICRNYYYNFSRYDNHYNNDEGVNYNSKITIKEDIENEDILRNEKENCEIDIMGMRIGTEVKHFKFGEGIIKNIENFSGDYKITVFFKDCGKKQLLMKYAKLDIIKY